jgi:hypothetical protein
MTDEPDPELPERPPPRRRRVAETHWVLLVILVVFFGGLAHFWLGLGELRGLLALRPRVWAGLSFQA